MLSGEARAELRRKMDEAIMSLVAVARAEDDVSRDLMEVAGLLTEANRRLEQSIGGQGKPDTSAAS